MFEEQVIDGTTAEDTIQEQETTQQEEQNNFEFALDDDGNIVTIEKEAATPLQEEEQQQPALYTAEEVRNTPLEHLDPSRLPPELVPFYRSMQGDYTRKTQELALQRKQLEQSLAQTQQPSPQTPVQPPENVQRAYYEQLYGLAKGNIEKAFGEEFDDLNPLHQSALMDEVANIKVFILEQQQKQRAYGQVISQYQADPEWSNMEQFALDLLNKLPYEQSVAVRSRIENGDTALLNDFLKYAKQEYYTKVKGVPQQKPPQQPQQPKLKPPVLESAGQGVTLSPTQQFDPRNLGKMSTHQQAKVFEDLGLTSF